MRSRGQGLANLSHNSAKLNVERPCSRPKLSTNKFHEQHYANFTTNPSNSYNVICRRQFLRKLDQLIAQKMATLREIHKLRPTDPNYTAKGKMERSYQISANSRPLQRSTKQLNDLKLHSAGFCYYFTIIS